jgi:DNA/RNA-binding domain of Phe-tRNA-synthetase-like protein
MKFVIDKQISEKFPDLNIGLIIVKDMDNTGVNQEVLDLIKQKEEEIKEKFDKETLSENSKIKVWREAYTSFGAKPKKYKCSVENLYRMILDDISLEHINKIVDIYNYISIKHMVPVGGDDIDKVEGDIKLRFANGTETFVQLNSDEVKNPKEGEVIYQDDKEVLCRRWNWRECDKSKMTEETKNVTLVVEGLNVSKEEISSIINELASMVEKYCGGSVETEILNNDKNELKIN